MSIILEWGAPKLDELQIRDVSTSVKNLKHLALKFSEIWNFKKRDTERYGQVRLDRVESDRFRK